MEKSKYKLDVLDENGECSMDRDAGIDPECLKGNCAEYVDEEDEDEVSE